MLKQPSNSLPETHGPRSFCWGCFSFSFDTLATSSRLIIVERKCPFHPLSERTSREVVAVCVGIGHQMVRSGGLGHAVSDGTVVPLALCTAELSKILPALRPSAARSWGEGGPIQGQKFPASVRSLVPNDVNDLMFSAVFGSWQSTRIKWGGGGGAGPRARERISSFFCCPSFI